MRKLFIPLAKLLGIYLFYRPLTYMAYLVYYLFLDFSSGQHSIWSGILYTVFSQILTLLMALILLFKTERIADIIQLPDDDINLAGTDRYSILYTGLILIGIGTIIYAVPVLVGSAVTYLTYRDAAVMSLHYQELQKIVSSILKTVLGIILVFKSVQIAQYFDEQTERMKCR